MSEQNWQTFLDGMSDIKVPEPRTEEQLVSSIDTLQGAVSVIDGYAAFWNNLGDILGVLVEVGGEVAIAQALAKAAKESRRKAEIEAEAAEEGGE